MNVYLEPGQESFVGKRAETVINLAKDIVKQDAGAKIIIGGDLNGQLSKLHTFLTLAGFTPALRAKTPTHRDGNQLDQMWVRNLQITNNPKTPKPLSLPFISIFNSLVVTSCSL